VARPGSASAVTRTQPAVAGQFDSTSA